jgi:hypothetical protein
MPGTTLGSVGKTANALPRTNLSQRQFLSPAIISNCRVIKGMLMPRTPMSVVCVTATGYREKFLGAHYYQLAVDQGKAEVQ